MDQKNARGPETDNQIRSGAKEKDFGDGTGSQECFNENQKVF